MNKARMISFVVTLSVLAASSSGFARGLCTRSDTAAAGLSGRPSLARSERGLMPPNAAGPCRAALLLSGSSRT